MIPVVRTFLLIILSLINTFSHIFKEINLKYHV